MSLRSVAAYAAAICICGALIHPALADDQPAAPAHPIWVDPVFGGIMFSGHIEGGSSINPDSPANNINFGQTFTDRANSFRINQALVNVEADLDPKSNTGQWGFKFTGMYGTDSRVTHFFNELDRVTNSPYQWDIVEAALLAHAPLPFTSGGIDITFGQYPTPIGFEVIDATGNPLYSHSYIFNYGLPFKHTGALTTTHVSDDIDIWMGIDTGMNSTIGSKGDNNSALSAILGVGFNNMGGGPWSILFLSHFGPENPRGSTINGRSFNVNSQLREIYDAVITFKINDSLTWVTELNRIHDDIYNATAGGAANYLTWKINDQWSVTGRGEIFADQGKTASTGFFGGFVCEATGPLDYVDAQRNLQPNVSYCGPNNGRDYNFTVAAFTVGANWTPPLTMPGTLGLVVRPEIRYDTLVGGTSGIKPFNVNSRGVGTKSSQTTLAVDAIFSF